MAFPVSRAVFCQLVAMEKLVAAESSVPPCVSISGPASCLLLLLQMEGALPTSGLGGQTLPLRGLELRLHSLPGRNLPHPRVNPAALPRMPSCGGPVRGSPRAGLCEEGDDRGQGTRILRKDPPACPSHHSLCVSLILASEFKGQGLFLFQSRWLLI